MTFEDRAYRVTKNSPASEAATSVSGAASGVFQAFRLNGSTVLVNLSVDERFTYRVLYKLTSLAMRTGGMLEVSNEDMAIFAFPRGGITAFLDEMGFAVKPARTVISPKEKGVSKVNIRFLGR
jgi:hypothetical protein